MSVVSTLLRVALVSALLVVTTPAARGSDTTEEPVSSELLPRKVLFIGNSHTARLGGLDWFVRNLVSASDPERPFEADVHTVNGVNLEYHYRNGAREAIRSGDYDTVVLQDYIPGSPDRTTAAFIEYGRLLGQDVQAAGARPVFYMTWPQLRKGFAKLDDFVTAHRLLATELGADVAPVGVAFDLAAQERPDLVLVDEDGIHATYVGAYLAALTVYATLFDSSPEGLAFALGLDPADAAFLQRIAWQAVTAWKSGEA